MQSVLDYKKLYGRLGLGDISYVKKTSCDSRQSQSDCLIFRQGWICRPGRTYVLCILQNVTSSGFQLCYSVTSIMIAQSPFRVLSSRHDNSSSLIYIFTLLRIPPISLRPQLLLKWLSCRNNCSEPHYFIIYRFISLQEVFQSSTPYCCALMIEMELERKTRALRVAIV